jgi:hypothetical protein
MRKALFARHPWDPRDGDDGGLVAQQDLTELLEFTAADAVVGLKQGLDGGEVVRVFVDAVLKDESVISSNCFKLKRRHTILVKGNGEPNRDCE